MMVRTTIGDRVEHDQSFLCEGEGSVEDSGVLTSVEEKDRNFSGEVSIHRTIFPILEQSETEDDD